MEGNVNKVHRKRQHELAEEPTSVHGVLKALRPEQGPGFNASTRRGSAEAILQALEQTGPLQFMPGELESLLAEIQILREMDLEINDRLYA